MLKRKDTREVQVKKPNHKKAILTNTNENKSGVVLKPLSKDEQKRILKADSKKEKKDAIDKIRLGKISNPSNNKDALIVVKENIKFNNLDNKEIKKDLDKKKSSEVVHEIDDRKKTQNTFGRKKSYYCYSFK